MRLIYPITADNQETLTKYYNNSTPIKYGVRSDGTYDGCDNYLVVESNGQCHIVGSDEDDLVNHIFNGEYQHIHIRK